MKSREWLLLNAVECWLHHYAHTNTYTEQYMLLRDEFRVIKDAPIKPKTTRKPRTKPTDDSTSATKTV